MNFSTKRKIWFKAAQVGPRQIKINDGCIFTFRGRNPYTNDQLGTPSEDSGTHHTVDESIVEIPEEIEGEFTVFLKLYLTDYIRNIGGLTLGYYTGDYAPEDQYYTHTTSLNLYDIRSFEDENYSIESSYGSIASYEILEGLSLPAFIPTLYHDDFDPSRSTTYYLIRIPIATGIITENTMILNQLFSGLLVFNNLEYYFGM